MTSGRGKTKIVTGLHVVRKQLKLGDRYYVYAWRGGPCIHSCDDRAPVITHAILCKQQEVLSSRYKEAPNSFDVLIRKYEASPEFLQLSQNSKDDYRLWLTRASERFGNTPVPVFNDRRMRGEIITWRNTWQDQPRTADKAVNIMSVLLGFAVEIGELDVNVAAKIKQLHHVNRADLIWEEEHWAAWNKAEVPQQLQDAIFFDSWTGLRLTDLISVTWSEVDLVRKAIIRFTNKGKKHNARAVIPIQPELMMWLLSFPESERTGTVLKNSRGQAWSIKGGIGTVFQRNKPKGFDRTIHDLRGTFCTRLIMKGLTDDQCAMIMGWTSKRVAAIRARYVDEARVILSMLDKLTA